MSADSKHVRGWRHVNVPVPRHYIAVLLLVLTVLPVLAQQPVPSGPLDQHALFVKDQVTRIGASHKLTVEKLDGTKLHGTLASIQTDEFSLQEVDLKRVETVRYGDVQKISKGFNHKQLITGQRSNPRPGWIKFAVIGAVVIVVVILAAVELRKA